MNVIRAIAQIQDVALLRKIERAARERASVVAGRDFAKRKEEAWVTAMSWKLRPGDLLFNHGSGMMLGPTWQRGDCGAVYTIQPRKRIIWLDTEYGWVVVRPRELVIDQVSPSLPDNVVPMSGPLRGMAAVMGKVLK
jgi:hypothetical protein